jgi:hypothetical protein
MPEHGILRAPNIPMIRYKLFDKELIARKGTVLAKI